MSFIGRVDRFYYWMLTIGVLYFKVKAGQIGDPTGNILKVAADVVWITVVIARFHDCNIPTSVALFFVVLMGLIPHWYHIRWVTTSFVLVTGLIPTGPQNRYGPPDQGFGLLHFSKRTKRNSRAKSISPANALTTSLTERRIAAIRAGR